MIEVDNKQKFVLQVSRAIFQTMPLIKDDAVQADDSQSQALDHANEIELTEDFLFFKQNLNVKKPMLLPLELQIQLKREKEKMEAAIAEAKARELEELENQFMQIDKSVDF